MTLRDMLHLVGAEEEIELIDPPGKTILGKSNVQSEALKSYYDWSVLRIYTDWGVARYNFNFIKTWLKIMIIEVND